MRDIMSPLLILVLFVAVPDLSIAQPDNGCPPSDEEAKNMVISYLTEDRWSEDRAKHDIQASPQDVHPLTEENDIDVCEVLGPRFEETTYLQHALYKAGNYYFNVSYFRPREEWPEGGIPGVRPGIVTFNDNMDVVSMVMF